MKKFIRLFVSIFVIAITLATTSIDSQAAIYIPTPDYIFFSYKADDVEDADYNILFIGNSITFHPPCDYWWGSWGMAASTASNDYVHGVVAEVENTGKTVDYDIISYAIWEREDGRDNVLPKINGILEKQYNLVVIQLGDNVDSTKGFEKDYGNLIDYIQIAEPNAQVVIVGNFWIRKGIDKIKENVAASHNCTYVDLSDFRKNYYFNSQMGEKVYGDDGQTHTINFRPVAGHPNDLGMKMISDRIIEKLIL
jgi:hypothetical protein